MEPEHDINMLIELVNPLTNIYKPNKEVKSHTWEVKWNNKFLPLGVFWI